MTPVELPDWKTMSMELVPVLKDLNFLVALCKWKYAELTVRMLESLHTPRPSHVVSFW